MQNALARIEPERRENPRIASNVPCTIFWAGLYEYATIRNISIYGAQLEGFCFPPVGTAVTILVDDVEFCASIIWADGEKCGVLLEHEVDPAAFIRQHAIRPIVENTRDPAAVTQVLFC
ncbi:PilZ domain-containing protein [Sphingobium sp. CR2-8]|uniref:PilZ domain-containing protein n=1 Tax=Sphingobium sp. CR2-8 TaxID=1306534 RepID=UPI002DB6963A|nr:PilZ domain-containing protein [Sphingobium sp. CR2-8]MEC3912411.1 PilZ domain-containing protein [Sphingobium sp. CR2-8]